MTSHPYQSIVQGFPATLNGYTIYTSATNQMVGQRNAIIQDNWLALEQQANLGVGSAHGFYREIRRYQDLKLPSGDFLSELNKHAGDELDRSAFFAEVKSQLIALDPNSNQDLLTGLDELAQGQTSGTAVHNLVNEANATEPKDSTMLQDAIGSVVALAVKSKLALCHTNFNAHHAFLNDTQAIGPHKIEFYDLLLEPINEFSESLSVCIKEIYLALVSGASPQSSIESLLSFVEESVSAFARTQAAIRQYALALEADGKGTASEKAGALATQAGDTMREALSAYCAGYLMMLEMVLPNPSKKFKALIGKAARLPYDSGFPNGKNTEIAKINNVSDGKDIEVIGKVTAINAWRSGDDKLVSQIVLYDASSGSSVTATGIFVHLRHIGLLEGSYCRISGVWKLQSTINNGSPAIEINKLKINELAKQSWRIAFLDFPDRFISRWPGGLNIQFGMAPHVSKPEQGNTESLVLGAGELIFTPFYR